MKNTIKEYKAHPLMILQLLKPFLFVLILPALTGLVQYLIMGSATVLFTVEFVVLGVVLSIALLNCINFRLKTENEKIYINKGFFLKKRAVIPFSKVSAVTVKQSFWEIPFFSCTVIINTEAGSNKKGDFEFKLPKSDANELFNTIYGSQKRPAVKFSAKTLLLSSVLTSSAITGLVVAVPFIHRLGKLFGRALSRALFDEISSFSQKFNTYFPPIFNTVMLILLLSYAFAVVYSFVKALNFRLFAGENHIEVHYGFFIRQKTIFKKQAITDISVEQTFLMYLFKRCMLCVSVAGYGDKRDKKSMLLPCERLNEVNEIDFLNLPYLEQNSVILRPLRGKRMLLRFIKVPMIIFMIVSAVVFTTALLVPYFERFILLACLPFLLSAVFLTFYFYYNYRYGKIGFGSFVYSRAASKSVFKEMYFPFENIAVIKITRGIIARKKGSCNVKITVRSQKSNRIKIWHLKYTALKENLWKEILNNSPHKGNTNQ
ncbi:MAG: hypothetical protein E7562_07605 [Ruminococcaceae bacterium]|nr:hypothetical protein [Oscillospiraceae bacterium]